MSNFDFIPQRKRQQHLFIVEGKHEKKELLGLMLQCFLEMNIQDENIVIYEKVICRSIRKASLIQNGDYNISDAQLKQSLVDMDAVKILKEQNRCSKDEQNGFVWVLNTSVLLVPDYSYDLITKHS